MEKRWCKRVPVSISVEIHRNGNRLGKCSVKDISLCGICLQSGPLAFYENTRINIRFPDAEALPGKNTSINANVVRNARHEIGLVFNPTEPDMLNHIIKHVRTDAREGKITG